jgi:hypothetical protein
MRDIGDRHTALSKDLDRDRIETDPGERGQHPKQAALPITAFQSLRYAFAVFWVTPRIL